MSRAPRSGYSPELRRFLKLSLDRPWIAGFVAEGARELESGTRVLDAGSGSGPYRELFGHCDYVTLDWEHSVHPEAHSSHIQASLDRLPLADHSVEAVVFTQVLEHVPDPLTVLGELHRVLSPGGRIWLTAPLVGELHEEPHDFHRFTSHGLRSLLERAGFREVDVRPFGGYFTTLAQLLHLFGPITGVDDRASMARRLAASALWRLGPALRRLDGLDGRRALPLGYGCRGTRGPSS